MASCAGSTVVQRRGSRVSQAAMMTLIAPMSATSISVGMVVIFL